MPIALARKRGTNLLPFRHHFTENRARRIFVFTGRNRWLEGPVGDLGTLGGEWESSGACSNSLALPKMSAS